MDYREQAESLLYDAKDWAGDPHIKKDLHGAAQSITDLLARAEKAEARAEKAESERDAAIQDMSGICYLCANAKPYSALSRTMMSCEYKQVLASIKSPGCEHFKWRGEKEE